MLNPLEIICQSTVPVFTARTSSVQTFDSLDFARYSDDGDRQETEKVAGQDTKYFLIF